jgi:hypothetical protein
MRVALGLAVLAALPVAVHAAPRDSALVAPALVVRDASAPEGNRGRTLLTFTVERVGPVERSVSVGYLVRGRSATAGRDFHPTTGRVRFAAGDRITGIDVVLRPDRRAEPDESLELRLAGVRGARVDDAVARGVIVDDDRWAAGPTVAAVGDLVCASNDPARVAGDPTVCQDRRTAELAGRRAFVAFLLLGDLQYEDGALARFRTAYASTWGRFRSRSRPVPGNHEYDTPGAVGYFDYFGAAVGRRDEGWYSFDVGAWHLVALNSNCEDVGGCGPDSAQARWLRADLAAHPARCTLAYWHHPRFTSGSIHADDVRVEALWDVLDDADAELVLAGHAHQYERFAPQTATGAPTPSGLVELVVGTGGRSRHSFAAPRTNSLVRRDTTFGILELTLGEDRYTWRYRAVDGAFVDAGSALCR